MARVLRIIALSILLALIFAYSEPARAIIYRHDVDASDYLLAPDEFPFVFEVVPGNGAATLIRPEWAVTAAHVTGQIADDGSHTVMLAGQEYRIIQVVVHPNWGGIHFDDIALLQLDRPVTDVEPAIMYSAEDEVSKTLLILGWGDHADGINGARNAERDGQFRGATNTVERIELGSLWVKFDAEDSPQVTDLEGIAGPGDSGGPAMIEVAGQYQIAGVASFGIEMGDPPPEPGTYGTFDTYTSISRNRAWIDNVLNGNTDAQVERDEQAPRVEVVVEADEGAPTVEMETGENLEETDVLETQQDQNETPVSSYLIPIAIAILLAVAAVMAIVRRKTRSQV